MEYIAFRSYSGETIISEANIEGNAVKLINYGFRPKYAKKAISLNEDSTLQLEESCVYASSITKISRSAYEELLREPTEEITEEITEESIEKVRIIKEEKYLSIEPWGEDVIKKTTWEMSDGSTFVEKKVIKSL